MVGGIVFAISMWNRGPGEFRQIGVLAAIGCALPFAFLMFRVARLFKAIGRAVLITPYESIPLGYTTTATYVRPLRGGASVESIETRLQCEERVIKRKGKNRQTFTEVVRDDELKPMTTPAMNELRVQIPIPIPESGPPSINDSSAEIRWVVRMRLRMRGCPDTRSSFYLDVLPVVVKR